MTISIVGSLTMILVMSESGKALKTEKTACAIINLEFAYSPDKVNQVIAAWSPTSDSNRIKSAVVNTQFDFIFLIFYSLFFYFSCILLSQKLIGKFTKVGQWIAIGALTAGCFDIVENIGMLFSLHGHVNWFISLFTFIFSIMKWLLVLFAVVYILAGLPLLAYRKFRHKIL